MHTLELFGVVPRDDDAPLAEDAGQEPVILHDYGVVVAPSAVPHLDAIRAFLALHGLTSAQLNQTSFYRSWQKAATVEDRDRIRDQVLHYFSTYGLRMLGLDAPEYIYLPRDEDAAAAPEPLALRVIRGVPRATILAAGLALLERGVALKQATVEALIAALVDECGYRFTGAEPIRNREALVLVADRTGVLPQRGEDLFRYLVWKASGQTLVIKNDALIAMIAASGYALPPLRDEQLIALAASFHRMKPLWMAFKRAHPGNRPVVNRLAKLAKRHHQPLPVTVLAALTATVFDDETVRAAARRATTPQLVRAINALRFYADATNVARFYRVRNGKSWAACDPRPRAHLPLARYHAILLAELQARAAETALALPAQVELAVPVSEKQCVGALPSGTRVRIPATGEVILIGVYWENGPASHVDLDLSAIGADGRKVGWNAAWRTAEAGLIYSGDVTNAPQGASEWLYGRSVDQPYLVTLNAFAAPPEQPYTIIIGYGDARVAETTGYQNYIIDPNRVVFSARAVCQQKQTVLGILVPDGDGRAFILIGQGFGEKIVSYDGAHEQVARRALVAQAQTMLRLNEVLPVQSGGQTLPTVAELLRLFEGAGSPA